MKTYKQFLENKGIYDKEENKLYNAVRERDFKSVELLLKNGAEDRTGDALLAAIGDSNLEMVDLLFRHGIKDTSRGTSLSLALTSKNPEEMVDFLLRHGSKDPFGSVYRRAIQLGLPSIADMIKEDRRRRYY